MAPVLPATDWITTSVELEISASTVVMSLPSSSSTPMSSTKAPRVPEPSSRETTVMGPEAAPPSVDSSEDSASLDSSEASEEVSLEEVEAEVEELLSEELLSVSPQAANTDTHSRAAIRMEIAFFIACLDLPLRWFQKIFLNLQGLVYGPIVKCKTRGLLNLGK